MILLQPPLFLACNKRPEAKENSSTPAISATLTHSPDSPTLANYYYRLMVPLESRPRETLAKEPSYKSQQPRYATIAIGNGADNRITVVVDDPGNAELSVYVDQNNDEDLTNDEPPQWKTREPNVAAFSAIVDVDYSLQESNEPLPYRLMFVRFAEQPDMLFYFRDEYRRGEITIDKRTYELAVFDDNADGLFNDLPNSAFLIDLNGDGTIAGGFGSYEYYTGDGLFTIGDTTYRVASINPTGTEIIFDVLESRAPDFTATDLAGNRISLSDYRGKVVLLDFWATWCVPCLAELPNIQNVYAKYKDKGFVVIGINIDMNRWNLEMLVQRAGVQWPQIHDGGDFQGRISQLYRVISIPNTFLIDKDGFIRNKNLRGPALESAVAALLGPGEPEQSVEPTLSKTGDQDDKP